MAKIWRNRLIDGTQKFSDCPLKYRDAVLALLQEDVRNGVITQEKYEQIIGS